jgi:aminoglycoside phosphotransferase (APT) family kinase protein
MGATGAQELRAFLTNRCGSRASDTPTQLGPGTWRLLADGRAIVAKRMPQAHPPAAFRQTIAAIQRASIGCPRLLDCLEQGEHWYALFAFVDGVPLPQRRPVDIGWDDVFMLLARLATVTRPLPPRNIERHWLERVSSLRRHDAMAARLLNALTEHAPIGIPCLAHGDFAPQNVLDSASGLVLIDWEEAGASSPGFDVGWLLALNRIGAGLRMNREALLARATALRIPISNAIWFEGLGLLRLEWRATSWLTTRPHLGAVVEKIRSAVSEFTDECLGALCAGP